MHLKAIGKFLDQPLLISKLNSAMPAILTSGALALGLHDTFSQPKGERKKRGIKNAMILSSIVAATLFTARGLPTGRGKKLFNFGGLLQEEASRRHLSRGRNLAVDYFIQENNISDSKLTQLLGKAKTKVLKLKEVDYVLENIKGKNSSGYLSETIFSKTKNLTSKEIFGEIARLSVMGVVPVAAGVAGGIAADKITKTETPGSVSNKIKEGTYQFLANIFLCNVGAAGALFAAEGLQRKRIIKTLTPLKKMGVISAGIVTTGIVLGSAIANFIGKKFLDPAFNKKQEKIESKERQIKGPNTPFGHSLHHYEEKHNDRKPEALDMVLHVDDIATAGVLSGLKWIEPVLPLMYMFSGYRAGFGYRNNDFTAAKNNFLNENLHKSSREFQAALR